MMPKQASLLGSSVSLDSPLEGHALRDLASITPGLARSFLFYFIAHGPSNRWRIQLTQRLNGYAGLS